MCRLRPSLALVLAFVASSFIAPFPARCDDPPTVVDPSVVSIRVIEPHPRDKELLPERQERRDFVVEVGKLLKSREFDKLNAIYAELLKSRARFSNAEPKLAAFYAGVTSWQLCPPNQRPLALFTMLREWQEKHPEVLAPLVAEAIVQHAYAWYARGGGYAHTVTPENAERYEARLVKARELVMKALKMQGQDPHLHVVVINVGRSSGAPIPKMKAQLEKAVAIDPDYVPAYGALGLSLLKRWYGAPGELESYLDEVATRTQENWGESGYTALAMYANWEGSAIFTNTKVDWERMKAGFEDLRRRCPDAISFANQYCKYALYANDRETAARLFQEIGEQFDRETWGSYRNFEKLRELTLNGPRGSEGQVVLVTPSPVRRLRFHPNGRLYTVTNTNNLYAWDPSNGLEAGDISTGKHAPEDFAFSRDGQLAAYYSGLKKTVVVQRTAGDVAPIATFAHENAPFDLCVAPDASFVVGLMQKPPEVYFYDMQEQQLRPFPVGESTLFSMALSPDGTTLVTGSVREFRVWEMPDANERKRVDDFTFTVTALAFSPNGAALAVGHAVGQNPAKGVISIYDTATWEKTADIAAHDLYPTRLRFSPNGELLASGSFDGSVKLWQVDGWKQRGELTDHKGKPIDNLEFSPDSQRLATAAYPDTRITPVSKPPFLVEAK